MQKAALILTASLLLCGCSNEKDQKKMEAPAVPVFAVPAYVKDIPVYVESIGTLQPSVQIEVRPQVNGLLKEVFVLEGQKVEEGTPLFQIDEKPYAIKVQEAKAQLAIDQAALTAAEKKSERYRTLAEKNLIAEIEWDELQTQQEKATALLKLDEAKLSAALLDLERCTLKSPVDGILGKVDVRAGQLIANGQAAPLSVISNLDPLLAEFTLTEKEFIKLPEGQLEIEITPLCDECQVRRGSLTFLDNQFDSKSGQLLVRGKLANPDLKLRPGQGIRVKLAIALHRDAILIPQKTIRYSPQGPYVYVVQADNSVAFRQVKLGDEVGEEVVALEGVNKDELVITEGHLRLAPGTKVEVKK